MQDDLQKRVNCPVTDAVPANIRAGGGVLSLPAATVGRVPDDAAPVGVGTSKVPAAGSSFPPPHAVAARTRTNVQAMRRATLTRPR